MPVHKKKRKENSKCLLVCLWQKESSICKSSIVFSLTNSKQLLSSSIRKSCLSYFSRLHCCMRVCLSMSCLFFVASNSNTVQVFTDGAAPVSALMLPRYSSLKEKKHPNSILSALWLFSLQLLCFPRVVFSKKVNQTTL